MDRFHLQVLRRISWQPEQPQRRSALPMDRFPDPYLGSLPRYPGSIPRETLRGLMESIVPNSWQPVPHFIDDQRFLGELTGFQFRVNQLAVDHDFKATSIRGLQFKRLNLLLVGSENLGRQTDGRGFVVSSRAVSQMDFHLTESVGERTGMRS